MNHLSTTFRRLRLLALAIAALGLLVLPSAASAKRHDRTVRDRNHDGIPDKWEKKFGISTTKHGMGKADPDKDGLTTKFEWRARTNPKVADTNGNGVADANEDPDGDQVDNGNEAREHTNPRKPDSNHNGVKDGKEDADHDKLNNAGEDDAGTDPLNPDTDGDGIDDGAEGAGEIVSFDGTTLTLRVYGGSTVSGTVDQDTYIACSDGSASPDDGNSAGSMGDGSVVDPRDNTGSGDQTADDGSGNDTSTDDGSTDPTTDTGDGSGDSTGDGSADDGSGNDTSTDDGSTDPTTDTGDGSADSTGDTSNGCSPDLLTVGAVVSEADFSVTPDGTFFDTIELAG